MAHLELDHQPKCELNCRKPKSEEEPVEQPSLRSKSISTIRNVRTADDEDTLFIMEEKCRQHDE